MDVRNGDASEAGANEGKDKQKRRVARAFPSPPARLTCDREKYPEPKGQSPKYLTII